MLFSFKHTEAVQVLPLDSLKQDVTHERGLLGNLPELIFFFFLS